MRSREEESERERVLEVDGFRFLLHLQLLVPFPYSFFPPLFFLYPLSLAFWSTRGRRRKKSTREKRGGRERKEERKGGELRLEAPSLSLSLFLLLSFYLPSSLNRAGRAAPYGEKTPLR